MEDFLTKQLNLLESEHKAEVQQSLDNRSRLSTKYLESEGVCLTKLKVLKLKTGLFGKVLVSVGKEHTLLPSHKLTPGDTVGVYTVNPANPEATGVVYKVKPSKVTVSFQEFSVQEEKCGVILLANDVTYRKQKQAIEALRSLKEDSWAFELKEALMHERQPRLLQDSGNLAEFSFPLNSTQRRAVATSFTWKDLGVIHGPPGTGKTTTVVELILQATARGLKVLATAPSNIAVDNMVERLGGKVKVCRVGHPARLMESTMKYSLDNLVKSTQQQKFSSEALKEIEKIQRNILKNKGNSRENRSLMRELRSEVKERQKLAVTEVLDACRVVLATNVSASSKFLQEYAKQIKGFDLVVIDEAAQALEASCWIPILLGKKLILAGDHKQLPPTILSKDSQELSVTLMERVAEAYSEFCVMLDVQYRMNSLIMNWSNSEFYSNQLEAHESVANHTVESYPPLMLVDTAGKNLTETSGVSKCNKGEAEIVKGLVEELKQAGVSEIGIITPYNAQVELLKSILKEEVSSVDGFQGREKEVIIITLVRSNPQREVGFLVDYRRLNVAVTRAKKLLCVVMDTDTIGSSESPQFLKSLVRYMREQSEFRSPEFFELGFIEVKNTKEAPETKPKKKKHKKKNQPQEVTQKTLKLEEDTLRLEQEKLNKILQEVNSFASSSSTEVYRTPNLSAEKRSKVHELCKNLNLFHQTKGSGKKKSISVSKVPFESKSSVQFEALSDLSSEEEESKQPLTSTKLQKQVTKQHEDEDKLLEDLIQKNKHCSKQGCTKLIGTIKVNCKHCRGVFCMGHGQAEAHGCNSAARLAAQNAPSKPPKKLSIAEKNYLKKKVQDKLHKGKKKK